MGDAAKFLKDLYSKTNVSNCSGFMKDVAKALGILGKDKLGKDKPVPEDDANGIINYISSHPKDWTPIGQGETGALTAATEAGKGYLVIVLLKGEDHSDHRLHGHVAIVLPPPLLERYPRVVCAGGTSGRSDGSKAVYASNFQGVWKRDDAGNVKYFKSASTFADLTP
jgi:hypothetical protein